MKNYLLILLPFSVILGCIRPSGDKLSDSTALSDFSITQSASSDKVESVEILQPRDYIQWLENKENKVYSEEAIGQHTFSIKYIPYEYMTIKEIGISDLNKANFDSVKRNFQNNQYIEFSIKEADHGEIIYEGLGREEFNKRLNYYSFEFPKDVYLVDGKDTLPCLLHHLERTYQIAPGTKINLMFSGTRNSTVRAQNKTLVVYDRILGHSLIKLNLQKENIKRIPELSVNL